MDLRLKELKLKEKRVLSISTGNKKKTTHMNNRLKSHLGTIT